MGKGGSASEKGGSAHDFCLTVGPCKDSLGLRQEVLSGFTWNNLIFCDTDEVVTCFLRRHPFFFGLKLHFCTTSSWTASNI